MKNAKNAYLESIETALISIGYNGQFIVSETDYGTSAYFWLPYNGAEIKVRVSDHSVYNRDRIENETHFGYGTPVSEIVLYAEKILYPERFERIHVATLPDGFKLYKSIRK